MKAENENQIVLWTLVASAVFAMADIFSDISEGAVWKHLFVEVIVTSFTLASIFLLWRRKRQLDLEVKNQKILMEQTQASQQQATAEALKWRQEASQLLKGLSDAIDEQFVLWQLTIAEKEVALLLLKGLSLKEIAEIRNVSEKTERAQSFSIYAKSGLSGRAQLSAFFLEDLMVPYVPNQLNAFN